MKTHHEQKLVNVKVIIADDHLFFRKGIEQTLRSIPGIANIEHANNGNEVLNLLHENKFDLVLMDVQMSPMDGVEATKLIRSQYPEVKVLALSMHEDQKTILTMLEQGASGYLLKNTDEHEIEEAIHDVLCGKKYFSKEVSGNLFDALYNSTKGFDFPDPIENRRHFREIMFLMCHQLKTSEIADALFLSVKSINLYRQQLLNMTHSKNAVGIVKYAIDRGIDKDFSLTQRFRKFLPAT